MNSMTGYGKSVAESDGRKITVEMKSVNHRFLDVTVKLPKVLSFAEDAVRRVLIDNFKRGHFDVYVTYENTKKSQRNILKSKTFFVTNTACRTTLRLPRLCVPPT